MQPHDTPPVIHQAVLRALAIDVNSLSKAHRDLVSQRGGLEAFAGYVDASWQKVRGTLSHPRYSVLKRAVAQADRVQLRQFRCRQIESAQARIEADHSAAVGQLKAAQECEQAAAATAAELAARHSGVEAMLQAKIGERSQALSSAQAAEARAAKALEDVAEGPAAEIDKASTGLAKARAAVAALSAGDRPEDQAINTLLAREGELASQLEQAQEAHTQAKNRLHTAKCVLAAIARDLEACAFIEQQFVGTLNGSIPGLAALAAVAALQPIEAERVPLRAPYFSDVLMHAQTSVDFEALCAPFEHLPATLPAVGGSEAAAEARRGPAGQQFLPDPVEGSFRVGGGKPTITVAGVEERVRQL